MRCQAGEAGARCRGVTAGLFCAASLAWIAALWMPGSCWDRSGHARRAGGMQGSAGSQPPAAPAPRRGSPARAGQHRGAEHAGTARTAPTDDIFLLGACGREEKSTSARCLRGKMAGGEI